MSRYLDDYLQALNQGRFKERGQLSATSHVLTDEKTKESPSDSPASIPSCTSAILQPSYPGVSLSNGMNGSSGNQTWPQQSQSQQQSSTQTQICQPQPVRQNSAGSVSFANELGQVDVTAQPTSSHWFAVWDQFNSLDTDFLPSAVSLSQPVADTSRPAGTSVHVGAADGFEGVLRQVGGMPRAYPDGMTGYPADQPTTDNQGLPPGMPYDASQGNWTW